ncbi:MAG: flagellar biosynthetic protein FliR [Oleiphilaceae bacterium]|jgi:flagellar biosynthetic protein FliR
MEFTDAQIGAWVGSFLWPLFRIASFLMIIPIFGTKLVPVRVRSGMAFLLALIVAPLIPEVPLVEALSLNAILITIQQVFIGSLMGLMFVMLLQIFVVAGQITAMQMGLGFASMVDPINGVNVPILSQIYLICVTLLFLAMNGHLVMIETIVESFHVWPISQDIIGGVSIQPEQLWEFLMRVNWLFASALLVALPVITTVLIVNISFGIVTRAAPQMNVFSLGFPIGMLFGLFLIWASISEIGPMFSRFSGELFEFFREIKGV